MHLFQIINDYYNDGEGSFLPSLIDNLIQCALYDIYDNYIVKQQLLSLTRHEELFMTFINIMHEHCRKERQVSFYADKMCITPRYLSRVVASITGLQTKELIDRHVILEIKVMLESTNLTIQEIAHRLNFPNQSFLGTYFKNTPVYLPTNTAPIFLQFHNLAYILTRETGLSPVAAMGRLICACGWNFVSHLKTGLIVDK